MAADGKPAYFPMEPAEFHEKARWPQPGVAARPRGSAVIASARYEARLRAANWSTDTPCFRSASSLARPVRALQSVDLESGRATATAKRLDRPRANRQLQLRSIMTVCSN